MASFVNILFSGLLFCRGLGVLCGDSEKDVAAVRTTAIHQQLESNGTHLLTNTRHRAPRLAMTDGDETLNDSWMLFPMDDIDHLGGPFTL